MGSDDVKTIKSTKLTADEAKKADKSKSAHGRPTATGKDVEGQAPTGLVRVWCCNCGAGNYIYGDTTYYTYFICWNCGWLCKW